MQRHRGVLRGPHMMVKAINQPRHTAQERGWLKRNKQDLFQLNRKITLPSPQWICQKAQTLMNQRFQCLHGMRSCLSMSSHGESREKQLFCRATAWVSSQVMIHNSFLPTEQTSQVFFCCWIPSGSAGDSAQLKLKRAALEG